MPDSTLPPLPRAKPHHSGLIRLWAEYGLAIEYWCEESNTWTHIALPAWYPWNIYRARFGEYYLQSGPTGLTLDPILTPTDPTNATPQSRNP